MQFYIFLKKNNSDKNYLFFVQAKIMRDNIPKISYVHLLIAWQLLIIFNKFYAK